MKKKQEVVFILFRFRLTNQKQDAIRKFTLSLETVKTEYIHEAIDDEQNGDMAPANRFPLGARFVPNQK